MAATGPKAPIGSLTEPVEVVHQAAGRGDGGRIAAVVSAIALALSGYSLWDTTLKQADVALFVPPVIQFAAPYQNSNFEMISIPVTLANDGARTGTVLSMELAVTDPRTNATKLFYAADVGVWSMERARSRAFQPFAPISLAGRSSQTQQVLFYTRGEDQKPAEMLREVGPYRFALTAEIAEAQDFGWWDRLWTRPAAPLVFERELRFYDARAFQNGTIPLYAKDWRSASTVGSPARP